MAGTKDIHHIRLLQGLDKSQLLQVKEIGTFRTYDTGDTIFKEGDPGSHIYCIADGRVEIVLKLDNSSDEVPVHTATTGSLFGEFVLFEQVPRTATAHAIKPTTIFAVDTEAFRGLFEQEPAIGYRVMNNLCEILVGRMKKTTGELRSSLMW